MIKRTREELKAALRALEVRPTTIGVDLSRGPDSTSITQVQGGQVVKNVTQPRGLGFGQVFDGVIEQWKESTARNSKASAKATRRKKVDPS